MTIDTLASFIAYGGIAVPHDQREALIAALRVHLQIAENAVKAPGQTASAAAQELERYNRIADAIHETECFLGMHLTPSPNPSPVGV